MILCGGKINHFNLPVSTNTNNSMIPINGKPVISWIIDDLIQKDITQMQVVLRAENDHLKEFIQRTYQNRLQLEIVELTESTSILESLHAGLKNADHTLSVRVILGDTLIKDDFQSEDDFIYVQEVEDSKRWCIASCDHDDIVTGYFDKQENVPLPHLALCGYYHFSDIQHLKKDIVICIASGQTQMSDLLTAYQIHHPVKAKKANEWFDFGNIDNLLRAKQQLLQSRYFNSLSIDPILNTITKVSDFDKKLRDELNWYKSLPPKLKVLTPRIISEEELNGKLNLTQEYYGYPTLAELYLFSDLSVENWQSVFRKLLTLHQHFEKYTSPLGEGALFHIYYTKTFERIDDLRKNNYWKDLFEKEFIRYNGKTYKNILLLEEMIKQKIEQLILTTKSCIIHGDLCFSNILYDLNNQIIRLIDPRGSFGDTGIYGDPRYDMAKLRHSICGRYDYIVSDLFEIRETTDGFEGTIFSNKMYEELSMRFDEQLSLFGYNTDEISFIEGLLFISMLPLHQDKPDRQKMMYITGLERLNKVL